MSGGRQADLAFPRLVVGGGRVRDAGVRLHEDLPLHGLARALHRVRRAHVPRPVPGELRGPFTFIIIHIKEGFIE